jgi:hypothetical protein
VPIPRILQELWDLREDAAGLEALLKEAEGAKSALPKMITTGYVMPGPYLVPDVRYPVICCPPCCLYCKRKPNVRVPVCSIVRHAFSTVRLDVRQLGHYSNARGRLLTSNMGRCMLLPSTSAAVLGSEE